MNLQKNRTTKIPFIRYCGQKKEYETTFPAPPIKPPTAHRNLYLCWKWWRNRLDSSFKSTQCIQLSVVPKTKPIDRTKPWFRVYYINNSKYKVATGIHWGTLLLSRETASNKKQVSNLDLLVSERGRKQHIFPGIGGLHLIRKTRHHL